MNFCAGMAPEWAEEIRHPDMESTEYWLVLTVLTSVDSRREIPVGLVQNGPEGRPQVAAGGVRFSLFEAQDCVIAFRRALDLVAGWQRQADSVPSEVPEDLADDAAAVHRQAS